MGTTPIFGVRSRVARGLLRNAVSLVVAFQTLTHLGPLSDGKRVLALGLLAGVVGLWTTVTTRRCGDLIDQLALLSIIGLGAALSLLGPNAGQVYPASYAALFVAPFYYGMPEGAVPAVAGIAAVTFSTMFVGNVDVVGGVGNGAGAAFFAPPLHAPRTKIPATRMLVAHFPTGEPYGARAGTRPRARG